ncbi:MAG TPA: hypothetical protein VGM63_00900, partial [Mucilaginibacter sp.]
MQRAVNGNVAATPDKSAPVDTNVADTHNLTVPALSTNPALRNTPDVVTKQADQSNQLDIAKSAYLDAHPGVDFPVNKADNAKVSAYKKPTGWENAKFGAQYLGSRLLHGGVDLAQGMGHLGKLISDIGPNDAETLARKEKAATQFDNTNTAMEKGADLGLSPNATTNSKTLSVAGDLLHLTPAILGSESSGGATWYLQGVGAAAKQVDNMKKDGVKFDNHSDELFVQGSGLINYMLGKAVTGTVLSKMSTGFQNDVIGSLSAEATKELANLGANATAEDVANVYTGKALNFAQKLNQYGMGMLKAYPHIATDFAGANLLGSGLKAGVNAMNGDRKPMGDVTGDEIVNDISSPIYNGSTPANGNLGQFAMNLVTSPAAGLSMLHGAATTGMLFDKSPYKNAVIESLQKDGSPENVAKVKDQITQQGLKDGWSDDEIKNTHTAVDALADITSKLPSDLPVHKFNDATNLILGRRQLEAVLAETQARKENLDPAIASKAGPFEALLKAKVEQANDKLDELITDKSYTYSEDGGKYYKTKLGEDPIEISKDRFDLEELENKSKPKGQKTPILKEENTTARSESKKPTPAPEPEPKETVTSQMPSSPATDTSMLDDLDNELESFKQSQEEPNDAIQKQGPGEVGVRQSPAVGETLGEPNGPEKPAGQSKQGKEVQVDEKTSEPTFDKIAKVGETVTIDHNGYKGPAKILNVSSNGDKYSMMYDNGDGVPKEFIGNVDDFLKLNTENKENPKTSGLSKKTEPPKNIRFEKDDLPADKIKTHAHNISAIGGDDEEYGHIQFTQDKDHPQWMKVLNVEVDPSLRGRRMQDTLYQSAINEAKKNGYKGILSGRTVLNPDITKSLQNRFHGEDLKSDNDNENLKGLTNHKDSNILQNWINSYNKTIEKPQNTAVPVEKQIPVATEQPFD